MILHLPALIAAIWLVVRANAHTVITYPGWRGDNLITNTTWPYGMQWSYPCKYTYLSFGLYPTHKFILGEVASKQTRVTSLFSIIKALLV
jgi:hypothetical protein